MKTNALLLVALALAACSPDFDPASKIDKLRVLAVKAEPPEIDPAGAAAPAAASLTSLVVRADFASDPARAATVVYLSCLPSPGNPAATDCVQLANLADPTAAIVAAADASCAASSGSGSGPTGSSIDGLAGVEECGADGRTCTPVPFPLPGGGTLDRPTLALPAGYGFGGAHCSDPDPAKRLPECILGVEADVLAFALDASWTEIAAGAGGACPLASVARQLSSLWSSREHVLSLKRVRIRGPAAVDLANQNPVVTGIADAAGTPLPATLPAHDVDLTPTPGDVAALEETYTKYFASGEVETANAKEDWVYSWFSTAGEMEDLHTRPPASERWKIGPEYSWSGSAGSATGGAALVAAVVRDLRGGVQWTVQEVTLSP